MRPAAYIYTCRNPGQVALLWAHQPPPFGHGWIDVKRVGLVRKDEVEALRRDAERYRKLQRWMSSNVKEGWQEVETMGALCAYMSWDDMDRHLDELSTCNVGLCEVAP